MANSHDLKGLFKFLKRDEWANCFSMVYDEHLGKTLRAGEMSFEELTKLIGQEAANTLWGCAFEDFLTQAFQVPGENLVDEYLKRRGWKETTRSKSYIRSLKTSVMSLYVVDNVVPGQHVILKDVLRGGDKVLVQDVSASKSLSFGQHIGGRVVSELNRLVLTGGTLVFGVDATETLMASLKDTFGVGLDQPLPIPADEALSSVAALFTLSWLTHALAQNMNMDDMLERMLASAAALEEEESPAAAQAVESAELTSATSEKVPMQVTFPLASKVLQKDILPVLEELKCLSVIKAKLWQWQSQGFSGELELKGRGMTLLVDSEAAASVAASELATLLGERVKAPEITSVS
ncbi:hypothetical protein ACKC9G_14530 [Pokkaliibacter sp. CJK22405]|uniref:hypothetical protein n=1 Tax=Pokkaliibacter sp. CJK22405 TaxID=3384615 RepID=UPI003985249B